MAMANSAVSLENVVKCYGQHIAVNNLSLKVPSGSIYGFIGPNGSGKTTTIRMILHIIFPDSGSVEVFGRQETRAANDSIGYLPEERGLYKKLTVRRQLAYCARLKGMSGSAINESIDRWLERMDLTGWKNKNIETLSKGMMQKTQFIAAALSGPELLILDEPFSGLDPVNLDIIRESILELRENGTTVILSTHDMTIAERMCDFIFMIYRGEKVLDGTLSSIKESYQTNTIRLRYRDENTLNLDKIPGVTAVNNRGSYNEIQTTDDPQLILQAASKLGEIELFEIARPSLHDIFVQIASPEREIDTDD